MQTREKESLHSLWVDWKKKIISFEMAAGFEELCFAIHEDKLRFAIEKGNEGFGIQ